MTQNESIPFLLIQNSPSNIWSHLNIPTDYSDAHWIMPLVSIFHTLKVSRDCGSPSLYLLHVEMDTIFQNETPPSPTHIYHFLVYPVLNRCLCVYSFYPHDDPGRHGPLTVYSFFSFSWTNQKLQAGRIWPYFLLCPNVHAWCFAHSSDLINNCWTNKASLLTLGLEPGSWIGSQSWSNFQSLGEWSLLHNAQ